MKDCFGKIILFLIEKKYNFTYEPKRWSIDITNNLFDMNDIIDIEHKVCEFNSLDKYTLFYVEFNEGNLSIRCQRD